MSDFAEEVQSGACGPEARELLERLRGSRLTPGLRQAIRAAVEGGATVTQIVGAACRRGGPRGSCSWRSRTVPSGWRGSWPGVRI
jgi:hypothetical protein